MVLHLMDVSTHTKVPPPPVFLKVALCLLPDLRQRNEELDLGSRI